MKMDKKLTRCYYHVKEACFGDRTTLRDGFLTISKEELQAEIAPLLKAVKAVDFELVKPGESTRIIHLLDTLAAMIKIDGEGQQYSGYFGDPLMTGSGTTNILSGFSVMESAALPWDESSASSGLLYPRDAILDMQGPIAEMTPFSKTINLIVLYKLSDGSCSIEYDNEIRSIGIKVATYLAAVTCGLAADEEEKLSIDEVDPELPNVVLMWNSQNQGPYSNTYLYGHPIDNLVPTLIHPNEMMDGCIVSGNYVWPAFKVPTYLYVNSPILLELYKEHGKTINFRGIIFGRSHNPSNWHKIRCAQFAVKIAQYLETDGLIMAWEGGGNAAVDGMLTIQCAEQHGIKASTLTFEFGGADGTEGILLVDDVPEADAIISGGSIEKPYTIPDVEKVVGGDVLRLNKESGGFFPPADKALLFEQTTHFYLSGNQSGASTLFAEQY